ncbi:hypothetical protein CIPAW_05G008700 [Carya illinoinensis]|uniref:Glycosyltransferase n=1 Tax=Carya illinoinensis TaxID=32201 RepID=A0A8T1QDZ2_CARIL|nr:hypothetical protein CIPAW_05G008700 [Carya illinoinensis]
MAPGHMIPIIDMARLFTTQGVKATIITTPFNEPLVAKTIERTKTCSGFNIDIKTIKFPAVEVGLPEGCENIDSLPSNENSARASFMTATGMLRQPLEQLLQDCRPHCVVADMFFPWATDVAAKFGIPRLVFHGTSFFSLSTMLSAKGDIFTKFLKEAHEAEVRSYGVVVNSFYELEPAYANLYIKVLGRKAWHIGPVSLCKEAEDKGQRGKESSIDTHECLKWLNTKNNDSVVYICFGSLANLTDSQLMEIAMGLEASEQQFIWVVKKGKGKKEEEDWMPKGFEKRMEGKGLIIRGWAPQVLILDHEAVGGFVTHCGCNSTLEGVIAGVPMVTWPMFADQFYNEKLVTEVLKIGVPVGAQQCVNMMGNEAYSIKKEAIVKAVRRIIMVSEEAKEMRSRAKALGEMARRAMEKGGSSYSDLNALIEELKILSG